MASNPSWSGIERWIWKRLCVGDIADLSDYDNRTLDPASVDGWDRRRILTPQFLENVLLHNPWASALPRQGTRIVGAFFDAPIELEYGHFARQLRLERSRFSKDVNLEGIETQSLVSFDGSYFNGILNMTYATIGGSLSLREGTQLNELNLQGINIGNQIDLAGAKVRSPIDLRSATIHHSLFMHEGAQFADISLRSAKIGDQLALAGSKVIGTLDMDSAIISGSLIMRDGATFKDVVLRNSEIGGQVDMRHSVFSGHLDMNSVTIVRSLVMRDGAEFSSVDLTGAKVGGQLAMNNATISGTLRLASATIGSHLFLRESTFGSDVEGAYIRIGRNLDLSATDTLQSVNLRGAHIDGELLLVSRDNGPPKWTKGALISLHNATVNAIQESADAWPEQIDVDGLVYDHMEGVPGTSDVASRGSRWYVNWLSNNVTYTPQPYEQLAIVLHRMGNTEEANDILYASRQRRRGIAFDEGRYGSWLGQSLLAYTIGYGLGSRYFRSLYWVLAFVSFGTLFLRVSQQRFVAASDGKPMMQLGIFYSLDMLLPIIELRKRHYDVDLVGLLSLYFYFHKFMGYVLASFLIAGLSGLTK